MKNLIICALLLLSFSGFSQTPDEIAQKFFKDIEAEGITFALNNASKDSVMADSVKLNNFIKHFSMQKSKHGKYYGYEKNDTDNFAQCLIIYSYILKYENSPAQLDIVFYKPNDKWMIHNILIKGKIINNRRNRK